jgi:hypothetical protein
LVHQKDILKLKFEKNEFSKISKASNLFFNQMNETQTKDLFVIYSVFSESHKSLYFSFREIVEKNTSYYLCKYSIQKNENELLSGISMDKKPSFFNVSPKNPFQLFFLNKDTIFEYQIPENGDNEQSIKNSEQTIFFRNPNGRDISSFFLGKEGQILYLESNNFICKYSLRNTKHKMLYSRNVEPGKNKKNLFFCEESSMLIRFGYSFSINFQIFQKLKDSNLRFRKVEFDFRTHLRSRK